MPVKIAKSAIAGIPDFSVRVAAHAKEMKDWRAQMKLAAEHKDNDKIAPIDRYVERPRPQAPALIDSAVNEHDEADFEIADDGPTPDQILTAKKQALFMMVLQAESAASAKVLPFGKRRLFDIRETSIKAADTDRSNAIMSSQTGILASIGLKKKSWAQVTDESAAARPADDTKYLADQAVRRERIDAIEHASAQMQSDIEDLTLDNIDAWKMTPFPN